MAGFFRSLFAELARGWSRWRSSRRPSNPFEDTLRENPPVDARDAQITREAAQGGNGTPENAPAAAPDPGAPRRPPV